MQVPDEEKPTEEAQPEGKEADGQAEEAPQAESVEEAPAEPQAEGEENQAQPSGQEQGQQGNEAEEKRKRAGGWQRKIERLERQNELLLQRLSQAPQAAPPAPTPEPTATQKAEAWIDKRVEERLAQREAERNAQSAQAEFQRRTAEVRQKNPDFDDVILSASDVPVSPALQQALLTSEHGPSIMYALAKNPAELARLSALPPLDAAREIGRLEARQPSPTAGPNKQKPAIRPPVPPSTVNGSAASTRNLDDLPMSEYKRAFRTGRR